ncbi:MAG: hypothetical protein FJ303_01825 [Planctomycetes bacterium]|nr:hypothetical protein [Planctomycetota bacterium]
MKDMGRVFWLGLGLAIGIGGTVYLRPTSQTAWAGNDRHEDYIMATGPIALGQNVTSDCIWLLDYRAGKLLGTLVDRNLGKTVGWAEVDLVKEFNIPPKQNVHFMMTTGTPISGNTALYLTEINTGRFGVYTMSPRLDGTGGMLIRRHDATMFRPPNPQ